MENLIENLERLVNTHSQSFDKGEKLNKQLKLLQIYLKDLYTDQKPINSANKHFIQYASPEFIQILESFGYSKSEDLYIHSGSVPSIPCEELFSKIDEFRHLSFAEIVEIVQAGKTPPGIKEINEVPLGVDCIKSSTSRPNKPWQSFN